METKIGRIFSVEENKNYILEAAEAIKQGGTVAFPTETVYGLGANALDSEAVKKIFKAKGRPQDNPLIIHVASKDIKDYVKEVTPIAKKIIDKFWPGPLTIILEKKSIIPNETSAGLSTIGVRMPNDDIALALIEESGVPIAAPSANISGRPSPTDINRCIEDLDGRVDYIIGGERSNYGVESTILDLTSKPPLILRPGGITLEMLKEVDETIAIDNGLLDIKDESVKPKAPGMKYKHYSPNAEVIIIRGNKAKTIEKIQDLIENYKKESKKVGVLALNDTKDLYEADYVISLGNENNLIEVAHNLFESLRICDDYEVDVILSHSIAEEEIGIAIMNRLKKAAGFNIIDI